MKSRNATNSPIFCVAARRSVRPMPAFAAAPGVGLRRVDVSLLAGMTVDYVVRLEQRRGSQPSMARDSMDPRGRGGATCAPGALVTTGAVAQRRSLGQQARRPSHHALHIRRDHLDPLPCGLTATNAACRRGTGGLVCRGPSMAHIQSSTATGRRGRVHGQIESCPVSSDLAPVPADLVRSARRPS